MQFLPIPAKMKEFKGIFISFLADGNDFYKEIR